MSVLLGVIEGFYGKPWGWETRSRYIPFLQNNNLNFYIYAPKIDRFLREDWELPFPAKSLSKLKELGRSFHERGLKWGIGLSPFNAYKSFNAHTKSKLKEKLEEISTLNPDILAILFDDMRGDIEGIMETQVEIAHFIADYISSRNRVNSPGEGSQSNGSIERILFCPTYYSFDPILEKVFGKSPQGYLEYIGENLDSKIDIIWTGPMVRSESITAEHLREVGQILRRKPFIWDNYIANDGEEHQNYIYLKPFRGRDWRIIDLISGYMINPMNQAELSKIPILTAVEALKTKTQYQPEQALKKAIEEICTREYTPMLERYREYFLKGTHNIPPSVKKEMLNEVSNVKTSWAREIVDWLNQ